jgi:hypothetical protein
VTELLIGSEIMQHLDAHGFRIAKQYAKAPENLAKLHEKNVDSV